MEPEIKTIAMSGAAWTVSLILSFSRSKFIEREMKNHHVFPDKDPQTKALMLGQVWDTAERMQPKPKGKKK